jgi:hypothetical protein
MTASSASIGLSLYEVDEAIKRFFPHSLKRSRLYGLERMQRSAGVPFESDEPRYG